MTYDNELLNPFADKHIVKNDNHFLFEQVRRAYMGQNVDYRKVVKEVIDSRRDLDEPDLLLTCQRFISNHL